jgi:hypothetical protein
MIGKLLKESILGRWFVPAEMECFKDQALAALGAASPIFAAMTAPSLCPQRTARSIPKAFRTSRVSSAAL